jgi:hypothetical protein
MALPTPPGVEGLPLSLYFDIDTRFSAVQSTRIRVTILTLISSWQQHYQQTAASGTSQWAACSNKYSIRKLSPVWHIWPRITNGEEALEFAMNVLTQRFRENGFRRVSVAKIKYKVPREGEKLNFLSRTILRKNKVNLSVILNPEILDNPALNNILLAGSLTHAWLHRCGYKHPKNVYTTYFIGEAPMCLMRNFQNKVPSQPDSIYTQYFD